MKRILFLFLIPFSILLAVFIVRFFTQGGEENALKCSGLSLGEAKKIAESNCLKEGTLKDTFTCNNYTKTWWIDLAPNLKKEGCTPACVVNAETKKAEINWRCTGFKN